MDAGGVSRFAGWSNTEASVAKHWTFDDRMTDVRHRDLRYSGVISDKLANELRQLVAPNNDVTDLGDEVTLLRHCLSESVRQYSNAHAMPDSTEAECVDKNAAVALTKARMYGDIDRVRDLCLSMAKIQEGRNGKVDLIVLNNLVQSVVTSVDEGLLEYAPQLRMGGIDPTLVAAAISQRVMGQVQGHQRGLGHDVTLDMGAQYTTNTPDQIVRAMDNATCPTSRTA